MLTVILLIAAAVLAAGLTIWGSKRIEANRVVLDRLPTVVGVTPFQPDSQGKEYIHEEIYGYDDTVYRYRGWDVSAQLESLGLKVPTLPEGAVYVFFESLYTRDNRYLASPDEWDNVLTVAYDDDEIVPPESVRSDTEVGVAMADAAKKVYAKYAPIFKQQQQKEEAARRMEAHRKALLNFVQGSGMPVLGEKQEWVDDA